ncbi:hypothetical protein FQR65_LT06967 [Abscondita terminalis]|nr:hypothetical protein FQR65_LT06967 [Abscondita terminalis]
MHAIQEAINNPKYRETVKMYAELLGDQSSTGLERAIWWTEYVLRHKGAPHLRNPAYDLPWYQYYYLDVIAFCLAVVIVFLYFTVMFIRIALKVTNWLVLKHPKEKDV